VQERIEARVQHDSKIFIHNDLPKAPVTFIREKIKRTRDAIAFRWDGVHRYVHLEIGGGSKAHRSRLGPVRWKIKNRTCVELPLSVHSFQLSNRGAQTSRSRAICTHNHGSSQAVIERDFQSLGRFPKRPVKALGATDRAVTSCPSCLKEGVPARIARRELMKVVVGHCLISILGVSPLSRGRHEHASEPYPLYFVLSQPFFRPIV
jgi:hypothetical protein